MSRLALVLWDRKKGVSALGSYYLLWFYGLKGPFSLRRRGEDG